MSLSSIIYLKEGVCNEEKELNYHINLEREREVLNGGKES